MAILISLLLAMQSVAPTAPPTQPVHEISGHVLDSSLRPVGNVNVTLLEHGSENVVKRSSTESRGEYFFDCVPEGSYDLRFASPGFVTQKLKGITYRYPGGLSFDPVVLHVGTGTGTVIANGFDLVLKVVDARSSKPIQGARVSVTGNNASTSLPLTDRCGRSWTLLSPGSYEVKISKRRYEGKHAPVHVTDRRLYIEVAHEPAH